MNGRKAGTTHVLRGQDQKTPSPAHAGGQASSIFIPHGCRHTWATWHYAANRDLTALMRLGGWKSVQMVLRYAHVNVGELRHTIDRQPIGGKLGRGGLARNETSSRSMETIARVRHLPSHGRVAGSIPCIAHQEVCANRPGVMTIFLTFDVDKAFSRKQRQSELHLPPNSHSVMFVCRQECWSNSGSKPCANANGENLEVTNLERTLIDITVRPPYAGGIRNEVLQAYRAARDRASVDRLMSILDELSYVYPYHQAVGFLMEAAGYGVRDTFTARQRKIRLLSCAWNEEPNLF